MGPDGPAPQEVLTFVASLDEVDLSRFRVVGTYTRYEEAVRNALQDARQKILAGFDPPGRKRENHLIWAAPGTGKTFFVQQVAASLPSGVRYHELNLAKSSEPEFRSGLGALNGIEACLCLVDEIDAKPQEPWPYEVLLPYFDAAVDRGARFVFVLAGSSGSCLDEIKQRIAARPKGTDLLSRIPAGHEYEIGPMSLGDRLLIVLSQLRQAGAEAGREIRAVEKLGLYYVALNQRLANARQLREFAVRAVERVPRIDDRVKYDHLFAPGDPENKAFWVQASAAAERLVNSFVILAGDRVGATPTSMSVSPTLPIGTAASPTAVAAAARPRTNLPRQLTSFIGRGREIAEVKRLLPTTGLLTITGAGGAGKTRLALQVAADLLDQYPDGVWLAQLGALSEPSLVSKAVASALDIPEQPGRPLTETVADYLQPRTVLIVLDNCEHLLQASADLISTLLRRSPNLRVLATSREVFGIEGELVYRIPSLSVPDLKRLPPPDVLTQYDAVRLFVERAAFSKPGFEITSGNAAAVAKVTHRLDGIPLAIELAAARVKALSLDQIAARLDDQFRLLTGGSRTGLPRHQTLRATLDWSHSLLSEQERILFRRLSVFAGGFTLEAAEEICAGDGVDEETIVDVLTRLVDKSLAIFDERDGAARYRLLESVREYGRDRLRESGESGGVRRRHRDWYLALAEQADRELQGPRQALWLERLETEHDNLRAALEWSKAETDGAEAGLRLAGALYWFWYWRGHWSEARGWVEGALERGNGIPPLTITKALHGATHLAFWEGDYARAIAFGEKGVALCRELNDRENGAQLLTWLARVATDQGHYERATVLFEESLNLCHGLGQQWISAIALALFGFLVRRQGDYDRAATLHMQARELARDAGNKALIAATAYHLGMDTLCQGDYRRAAEYFREGLSISREMGLKWWTTACLEGLAGVDFEQHHYEKAACLYGAAEVGRETLGLRRTPTDQADHDRFLAATRAALGETVFAAAWTEGRAMTLEQAIEYTLAEERSGDKGG